MNSKTPKFVAGGSLKTLISYSGIVFGISARLVTENLICWTDRHYTRILIIVTAVTPCVPDPLRFERFKTGHTEIRNFMAIHFTNENDIKMITKIDYELEKHQHFLLAVN